MECSWVVWMVWGEWVGFGFDKLIRFVRDLGSTVV